MNGFSHRKTNAERRGGEGKEKEKVKKGEVVGVASMNPFSTPKSTFAVSLNTLGGLPCGRVHIGDIGLEK